MTNTIKQPDGMTPNLPNCGVVAVATALSLPYDTVYTYFRTVVGKPHQWRGKLRWRELTAAVGYFKGTWEERTVPYMNLAKWVDQHTVKGRTYIVRLGGHFVTVKDGIIVDQSMDTHIDVHWARRKMVCLVAEVAS